MATPYANAEPSRPARPLRTVLITALIAFLAGVVAMGLALRQWSGEWGYFGRKAEAPAVAVPAPAGSPQRATMPLTAGSADDLSVRVRDLEERLARISLSAQAASGNAARAEGLLVAFAARRALDRGVALGYVERQLSERFGAAQPRAVALVIAAARQPVTLEALRTDLEDLAPRISNPAESVGWWEAAQREASQLIVVRRAGAPSPAPSARLDRARRALQEGAVEKALAEVARMPGRGRAENWMANARRYIEARRALEIIEAAAILTPAPLGAPAVTQPARP